MTVIARGNGDDFFEGGLAGDDLLPAVFPHRDHALLTGLGAEDRCRGPIGDEFLHFVGDGANLDDGRAARGSRCRGIRDSRWR